MSDLEKSDGQSMEEILASIRSSVDTPNFETEAAGSSAGPALESASPPNVTGPRNGGGRLQDALSQIAVASAPGAVAPAPTGERPPAPPTSASAANQPPAADAPVSSLDSALDDLFEPDAPKQNATPTLDASTPSEPTLPPQPFGKSAPPAPSEVIASAEPQDTTAPNLDATEEAAPVTPSAVQRPENESASDVGVAPVRKPDFGKLSALATGASPSPSADSKGNDVNADKTSGGVLLPEMRDMAGSNPVAQMQSMAAAMGGSQGRDTSSAAASTPSEAATPAQDDVETEIISATQSTGQGTAQGEPGQKPAAQPVDTGATSDGVSDAAVSGGRTLEDIVAELLKPQLERWLEANMPRIVERALRAEQKGPNGQHSS